jgi:hypothetical protein
MNRYLIIFIFSWLSLLFSTTAISNCPAPVRLSHEDAGNGCITLHWELPLANKMLITNPLQPTRGSQPPYDTVKAIGTKLFTPVATKTTTNADVLFDQSELITYKGIGYNGADVSSLYGNMTSLGANANHKNGYWVADDFTLTANTVIDEIDVYAYQSFYIGEKPPIKKVFVQIYDRSPCDGGTVIWGSDTANVPSVVEFSGIYRVGADVTARDRAIYKVTASIHTILPAGTYWVAVSFSGDVSANIWAPPRTLLNATNTGNALQYGTEGWQPWIDAGSAGTMGLPMTIRGIYNNTLEFNIFRNNVKINSSPLTDLFYSDSTIEKGASYCYQVQAVYASCQSELSLPLCVKTLGCPLPQNVRTETANGQFTLRWQAVGTENGWRVVVADTAIVNFEAHTAHFVTDTVYTLTNITSGKLYYCYVQSDCGNNERSQWAMANLITFPTEIGTDGKCYYLLTNEADLCNFRDLVFLGHDTINGKMTADITFENLWYPIGTTTHPYRGTFDGNGHTLSEMNVQIGYNGAGLFGVITGGAHLKNIGIKSGTICTSGQYAGGIAGYAIGKGLVQIERCYNEANVASLIELKREARAGGILGSNCSDTLTVQITYCYNTGHIGNFGSNAEQQNGGLSGWLGNNALLKSCFNLGFIYGDSLANSPIARFSSAMVKNCYFQELILGEEQRDYFTPINDKYLLSSKLAYDLDNGDSPERTDFWSQGEQHPILADSTHFSIYKAVYSTDNAVTLRTNYYEANRLTEIETSPMGYVAQRLPSIINSRGNAVAYEGWNFVMPTDNVSITADYTEKNANIPLWIESFENYVAGGKVAQQAAEIFPGRWTTWNNKLGEDEDAEVSSEQACHGEKAMKATFGNDILLLVGKKRGAYALDFKMFVPNNKNAYFNLLHSFNGDNSEWAFQAYFNADVDEQGRNTLRPGFGYIDAGAARADSFLCVSDQWMDIHMKIDIDKDSAEFALNGQTIHQWQWSLGTFGATSSGKWDAIDFFPPTGRDTSEFFIDSIALTQLRANLPCFAPTHPKVVRQQNNEVTITWIHGGDETRWRTMLFNVADSANSVQFATAFHDTITFKELVLGASYKFRVQANCDSSDCSEWSEACTFTLNPISATVQPYGQTFTITPNLLHKGQNIHISADNVAYGTVEFYNIFGQKVSPSVTVHFPTTIPAPRIDGIYILRVKTDNQHTATEKIIVR